MTRVQAADVRVIVAETLGEQQRIGRDDIDAMVVKAVATTLTSFGIDADTLNIGSLDRLFIACKVRGRRDRHPGNP